MLGRDKSRKWLGMLPMGAGLNSIELTLTGAEGSSLPTLIAVLGSFEHQATGLPTHRVVT
jgi:hypothetical protein